MCNIITSISIVCIKQSSKRREFHYRWLILDSIESNMRNIKLIQSDRCVTACNMSHEGYCTYCSAVNCEVQAFQMTHSLTEVQYWHEKQRSSQRKCRDHRSNQPSHRDNATHQGISISQPCYEDKCMECHFFTQCPPYSHAVLVYNNLTPSGYII